MTRNEKKEFKKWNISIEQDNARKKAGEIEQKYLELNGKRSCNPERFLYEIVTTNGVEVEEKIKQPCACCREHDPLAPFYVRDDGGILVKVTHLAFCPYCGRFLKENYIKGEAKARVLSDILHIYR